MKATLFSRCVLQTKIETEYGSLAAPCSLSLVTEVMELLAEMWGESDFVCNVTIEGELLLCQNGDEEVRREETSILGGG